MLDEIANAGVRIKEVSLPDEWDFLTGSSITTASAAERCETFMEFLRRDVRGFGVSLNSWLRSLFVPGHDYVTWLRLRMLLLERSSSSCSGTWTWWSRPRSPRSTWSAAR